MKVFCAAIVKGILRGIYFFLKLFPTHPGKVTFLSRQSDEPSLDFLLLEEEIRRQCPDCETVFLCRRMGDGALALVRDFFVIVKQMKHLAESRVCILDSYSIPVSILKHKKELFVLQIWHAMGAIKKFGYQSLGREGGRDARLARAMEMHKGYDAIVSGSQAMVPFFAEAFDAPRKKFLPVGMPRIDYLLENEEKLRHVVRSQHPEWKGKTVVLYAPTFRRNREYQTDDLLRAMDWDKYVLIVKGHPLKELEVSDSQAETCDSYSAMELLPAADIVITDYSAISIEAAALLKPVYFYVYDLEEYARDTGLNIDLEAEMPGCVYRDAAALAAGMEREYPRDSIRRFRDTYVAQAAQKRLATKAIAACVLQRIKEAGR